MPKVKEPTSEEIEQAAHMCVSAVRNGRSVNAFIDALQVVRNWDPDICQQIEKRANQLLGKRVKAKKPARQRVRR